MCRKPGGNASLMMTSGVLGLRQLNDSRHREQYLPVTGEIQNTRTGNVYVFGNSDVTEEEINTNNAIELPELRVRGKIKPVNGVSSNHNADNGQNSFIERIIIPSDSLQAFALQYGCPVSEIKRLNNLINDQDFYALTSIKLPVRQFGLLHEEEEERRRRPHALNASADALVSSSGSLDEEPASPFSGDESSEEPHHYRTISLHMKDESDKRKFLKRMDKDLQKIWLQTKTSKDSLDEVTKELTETKFYPLNSASSSRNKIGWLSCDMSGKTLVLLVVGLISVSVIAGVVAKIYSGMT